MTESTEQPKRAELSLTREFLVSTFTNPAFIANITAINHHSNQHFSEGGFIVQKMGALPVISDVTKSPPMGSYEERGISLSVDNIGLTHDIAESESEEGYEFVKKPNIAITVHSHPLRKGENPYYLLRPSMGDLEAWHALKAETGNPYLIEVIVVGYKEGLSLFLYQLDPNTKEDAYWQQYDDQEPQERLFRYMKESGIRFDTLKMDFKASFSEKELAKLDQFVI